MSKSYDEKWQKMAPADEGLIRFAKERLKEERAEAAIREIYIERWNRKFDKALKYPSAV